MENKKSNGLVIVLIIILIVSLIGIGGAIYFHNKSLNVNNKEDSTQENPNEIESNEKIEKITIEQLKNKYEADISSIAGQFIPTYNNVKDKEQNKIIIDNLEQFGASSLYFIISNNKGYIYMEERVPDFVFGKARLYDLDGNIIFDALTTKQFKLIKNDSFPYENSPVYVEENIEGVYYSQDGVIGKYSLDGTLLSSTKKYDEVEVVGLDYSLIYNKNDNSSYVISNDDSYSMKITNGRITDAYSVSYDENNKEIKIYYDHGSYYLLNLNNNKITKG